MSGISIFGVKFIKTVVFIYLACQEFQQSMSEETKSLISNFDRVLSNFPRPWSHLSQRSGVRREESWEGLFRDSCSWKLGIQEPIACPMNISNNNTSNTSYVFDISSLPQSPTFTFKSNKTRQFSWRQTYDVVLSWKRIVLSVNEREVSSTIANNFQYLIFDKSLNKCWIRLSRCTRPHLQAARPRRIIIVYSWWYR